MSQLPDWKALRDTYQHAADCGELDQFRRRRWQYAPAPSEWLEQNELESLGQFQAESLYRAAGGRKIAEFRKNTIEEIRETVDFLLYDTIKLENRFEECATETGGFGLAGIGKEWPSYLLTLRDPQLFAPWSPHTERALTRWGLLPSGFKKGHPGLCYIDLLDILYGVTMRVGLTDFRSADEFCYLNGRSQKASR